MFTSALSLLALATSALAITITTPDGWTANGPNKLEFKAVSTDPTSFAVVLVNQNSTLLSSPVILVKNQSTSASEITISPGCGEGKTLPVGGSFQINFVANAENLNSISAQSNMFNITSGGTAASCSSSTAASKTGDSASKTSAGAASQTAASTTGAGFSTSSLSSSAVALAVLGLAGFTLL